jgi:adenylate cyclase class 2
MPIEVELKARVHDADNVLARLRSKSHGQPSTYRDTYYDWPDRRLEHAGRQELRIRVIEADSETRALWTFKGAMLDAASTPEFETMVTEPEMARAILAQLGLEPVITYTKHCVNFTFDTDSHQVKATVVRVPELEGTFLEIETLVLDETAIDPAQAVIRGVLAELDIAEPDLEPTFYVDMVAGRRDDRLSVGKR